MSEHGTSFTAICDCHQRCWLTAKFRAGDEQPGGGAPRVDADQREGGPARYILACSELGLGRCQERALADMVNGKLGEHQTMAEKMREETQARDRGFVQTKQQHEE
eukprot:2770651-Rhodomonas_salina.4